MRIIIPIALSLPETIHPRLQRYRAFSLDMDRSPFSSMPAVISAPPPLLSLFLSLLSAQNFAIVTTWIRYFAFQFGSQRRRKTITNFHPHASRNKATSETRKIAKFFNPVKAKVNHLPIRVPILPSETSIIPPESSERPIRLQIPKTHVQSSPSANTVKDKDTPPHPHHPHLPLLA